MKKESTFKMRLTKSIIALFLVTLSSELSAQEAVSTNLADFKITIEKTDDGLKIKSLIGSAWVDLSFIIAKDKPQAIDEYGMTKLGAVSATRNPKLADYLFTITKTKNGISLKGIDGTAWKVLSFNLPKNGRQTIDQFGMTE